MIALNGKHFIYWQVSTFLLAFHRYHFNDGMC